MQQVQAVTAQNREWTQDQRIANAIRACLQQSPYLAIRKLTCDFREGVAILRGAVPTYYTRQVAMIAACGVDGVQEIDDRIQVSQK